MTDYYITDRSLKFERYDDTDLKNSIREKWTVSNEYTLGLCGNLQIVYDTNGIATLTDEHNRTKISSYKQISSALALYRTITLFECGLNSDEVDFYKCNWRVKLTHKKTNTVLALSEWKGAFQIFTPFYDMKGVSEEYKHDVEELLTLLASPTMTIGYDGTVAGTIA